jgi:hypothetical protein
MLIVEEVVQVFVVRRSFAGDESLAASCRQGPLRRPGRVTLEARRAHLKEGAWAERVELLHLHDLRLHQRRYLKTDYPPFLTNVYFAPTISQLTI